MKSRYVCLLMLLMVSAFIHSQAIQEPGNTILRADENMWQAVKDTYQLSQLTIESQQDISDARRVLGQACTEDMSVKDNAFALSSEAEYWDKNYGLELRGGLVSQDLDDSDIDRGGVSYVELSWEVLDNGYKEFDYRAKDLKRKAELERINGQLRDLVNQYRCRHFQIADSFVGIEAKLATAKLNLMEDIYRIEQAAYFNQDSRLDELLVSEESLRKLRRRLKSLNSVDNYSQKAFTVHNLPAFDINIQMLLQNMSQDPKYKSALSLERQRATHTNPYQDGNRLRFFIRKEVDIFSSDRDDLIAGLRFSVPLVFADRPNQQYKLNQLDDERKIDEWERVTRVREAYQRFDEQSDRVLTQQYRYLRSKERMRRVFSRQALGDELVLQAVTARLLTYLDASLELVRAKQALFERANAVFLASRISFSPEYISAYPMSIDNYRARPFSRGVYVWSSAFNRVSNEQLLLVLQTQGLSRVILSYSQQSDMQKLAQFQDLADSQGITLELMFSDNEWIYERNHLKAAQSIAAVSLKTDHIHLDIEPQALESYKGQELLYQQRFVNMLKEVRLQNPDISLGVSVPFHWENETYQKINEFCDKIVVMNYENDNPDTLIRRIKSILQVLPLSKTAMALRPKDFESPNALEQTLQIIEQSSGVDEFVFHKLDDLIEG